MNRRQGKGRGNAARRHKRALRAVVMMCFAACAGCTQGPDYARPEVAIPQAYRFQPSALTSSALPAEQAWWQSFGDDTLDGLIRECIANNHDLRIAAARVDEYEALLMGTRSQAFPQIGYVAGASHQRASEQGSTPFPRGVSPVSSSFSAALSASWEIDLWGRIKRETEAARANLLATEEARRGVVLTLVASTIRAYITLLDFDGRLQVAEATVASRQEAVRLFRMRLDGGVISDFEMAQVLAEYESAVTAIPELKQLIAQQENALSILLGRNPGPIERGRSLSDLSAPAVPASLPSDLLARRPDIAQAEQQLIASNAYIGAARALYFPRISLTAVGGLASAALGNLFSGSARTWSFAGDVAGPIYTGGGLAAATGQAEARREQALAAYERTIQNAFREVEDALVAIRSARELEESFERRVATLRRAVVLARERYDNGYSDALDLLDAERNLFSAELALVATHGDRHRALIDLYRVLGGDWVDEVDQMAISARRASDSATVQEP